MAKMIPIEAENWLIRAGIVRFPHEDSLAFNKNEEIASVADGVTRDLKTGNAAMCEVKRSIGGYIQAFRDVKDINKHYPFLSQARAAADAGVYGFVELTMDIEKKNRTQERLKKVMLDVNSTRIAGVNRMWGLTPKTVNYLERDYAGCVLAGTAVRELTGQKILSCCHICDCGVVVFDEEGNIVHATEDNGPSRYHDKISEEVDRIMGGEGQNDLSWRNARKRQIIRSRFRDNPSEEYSYGVLTGEENKKIEPFIETAEVEIKPGYRVVVYTDGAETSIYRKKENRREVNGRFVDLLMRGDLTGLERLLRRNVHSEGTLIVEEF